MRLPPLVLRDGDRDVLESRGRSEAADPRGAQRARLVLLAADGRSNRKIATQIGMHYNQVALWRKRYREFGLAGLADGDRPGRVPIYGHGDVLLIVKAMIEPPPDGANRWTMAALARRLNERGVGISASQVWRLCTALDLKPWRSGSWITSHDPDFLAKAADVCGLYLDSPCNAVVWSVDEKFGIAAPSRTDPTLPAGPGTIRRESGSPRHGTAELFATLDVHGGDPTARVTRSETFVEFLADVVAQTPTGLELRCIVDNLASDGTPLVEEFLDRHPRVFLHRAPTHAGWLNQVELLFAILEGHVLRGGEFSSVDNPAARIIDFINDVSRRASEFRWTYGGRPGHLVEHSPGMRAPRRAVGSESVGNAPPRSTPGKSPGVPA